MNRRGHVTLQTKTYLCSNVHLNVNKLSCYRNFPALRLLIIFFLRFPFKNLPAISLSFSVKT